MSFDISPTGVWLCDNVQPHSFDEPMAFSISTLLKSENCKTVIDFGCGSGAYVKFLIGQGFDVQGYDGNPNTPTFDANCHVADLSVPMAIQPADWVLSLETGEHIPGEYENQFIANITRHALHGVVLSWFPEDGHGIGHCNPRSNDYVKLEMAKRGFYSVESEQEKLREASTLWWFGRSVMVFKRL